MSHPLNVLMSQVNIEDDEEDWKWKEETSDWCQEDIDHMKSLEKNFPNTFKPYGVSSSSEDSDTDIEDTEYTLAQEQNKRCDR